MAEELLLGAHFSISGGLHHAIGEAKSYGCNVLQIFTKNAATWREKELTEADIRKFKEARQSSEIRKIAAHASYLINIAGGEKRKVAMSCKALKQELIRCNQLGIEYLVVHPGSHMGQGEEDGILQCSHNINKVFEQTTGIATCLLLETTAGQGTNIGCTFEQMAGIMKNVQDNSRIGICLDTCHIFAAGYDISTCSGYQKALNSFDEIIGLRHLHLIHINDSKKGKGLKIDRHEHIGRGAIGIKAFEMIINDFRFKNTPKIIETPKGRTGFRDWDKINLNRLRSLLRK